ncbi:MAG: phospho-N-acetylmuramoyl-pentapeptide-transferase [Bacillota bacterium]|jgi:phospho-N-acetylmuramoyl-pentapeptide-transferase
MSSELRLLGVAATALLLGLLLGPVVIPLLRRLRAGQTTREDGPATHLKKSGTPTMGGIIFLLPTVVSLILWVPAAERQAALAWLWLVLGSGLIGFVDDYIKVVKKQSLGLMARYKLLGQLLVATVFYLMLRLLGLDETLVIPWLGWEISLGWGYLGLVVLMNIAATNAVNLTDGVDGLASSCVIISSLAYLFVGLVTDNLVVAIAAAAMIGGLLAFLRFNWHPAQVFMGDVGSLALGAGLAGAAILTKTELLLIPIGIVYVLEALSDILQVTYFRLTGGKRIFKMAPLHHHFELSGWSETRVVALWCALSALGAAVGLVGLSQMTF